jgi:hypothetical protein
MQGDGSMSAATSEPKCAYHDAPLNADGTCSYTDHPTEKREDERCNKIVCPNGPAFKPPLPCTRCDVGTGACTCIPATIDEQRAAGLIPVSTPAPVQVREEGSVPLAYSAWRRQAPAEELSNTYAAFNAGVEFGRSPTVPAATSVDVAKRIVDYFTDMVSMPIDEDAAVKFVADELESLIPAKCECACHGGTTSTPRRSIAGGFGGDGR